MAFGLAKKMSLEHIAGKGQKCRKLLLQMTVEWWEMNLETCSGYEKHSSGSGQYVSKKIMVIRRVELKILQEIDEKVEKEL